MSSTPSVSDRLSAEIGFDVDFAELQLRFRLDLERMKRGESAELGYVFVVREQNADAVVVFATPDEARQSLTQHPLIDSLCEEDAVDAYAPDVVVHSDLTGHEIIMP